MAMRRTSIWTIVATFAGVMGAGASIYALLKKDEHQVAHIVLDEESGRGSFVAVYVHTLSEPVVLTGAWTVRKKQAWWWENNVLDSTKLAGDFLTSSDFKDRRVNAASRTTLIAGDRIDGFERCNVAAGALELAVEIKSKSGIGWPHVTLPYCGRPADRSAESGRRNRPVVSDDADYWKNIPLHPPASDTKGKLDAEAISRLLNKVPPAR